MGNSASSSSRGQHEETVDYGHLYPQGVYTGPKDWNHSIVTQLIIERKLAPFYRPLEDYEEDWDDEHILAARKEFPEGDGATTESSARIDGGSASRPGQSHNSKRTAGLKEPQGNPEAAVYRGAVECPICFLYYPSNINHSRCCDQAICTECFVQIKRNEPTTTHLVSEPAACPYCVQDNFGVTYIPPSWRAGIGSEGSGYSSHPGSPRATSQHTSEYAAANGLKGNRRKSFGHDHKEVVTIDHIRPDWEAKLAAVRAAVARRANRRIIMRQVGDRLIPVGVTSGRVHPLTAEGGLVGEQGETAEGVSEGRSSRRSRRRQQQQQDLNNLLGSMGMGGQDLEEIMVMEAMRLSLLEHEERQRREANNKNGAGENSSGNASSEQATGSSSSSPRLELPPIPTSEPIDVSPRDDSPSPIRSAVPTPTSAPAGSPLSSSPGSGSSPNFRSRAHVPVVPSPLSGSAAVTSASALPPMPDPTRFDSVQPRRSGEAPRFSTLSAALAAHSTATAPNSRPLADIGTPDEDHRASGMATPTVTPAAAAGFDKDAPSLTHTVPPVLPTRESYSSSIQTANGRSTPAYDALPSSPESSPPESLAAHRPLLVETPAENMEDRQLN